MSNAHHSAGQAPDSFVSITVYNLETTERVTRLSREQIVFFYREGLVAPVAPAEEAELAFDESAILRLRRIHHMLVKYQLNHPALKHFAALWDEVEKLREEVRFLRQG